MSNTISFDFILSRIGFGQYQIRCLVVLSILEFIEGYEVPFGPTFLAILKDQGIINNAQLMTLSSVYFMGRFSGLIAQSFTLDFLGRKNGLILVSGFMFYCTFLTAFAFTFDQLVGLRFFFGFFQGLAINLCLIYVVEIVPYKQRGKLAIFIQGMFSLGKLYLIIASLFFVRQVSDAKWRSAMLAYSLPALICFIASIHIIDESPRYLLIQGRIMESVEILNKMAAMNQPSMGKLQPEDIGGVRDWQVMTFEQDVEEWSIMKMLKEMKTIRILTVFGMLALFQAGINIIQPFLLQKFGVVRLIFMLMVVLGEVAAVLLAFLLIDEKKIGRKRLSQLVTNVFTIGQVQEQPQSVCPYSQVEDTHQSQDQYSLHSKSELQHQS